MLARGLGVSPATVAAAYRTARTRGLIATDGRRGTHVSPRPPLAAPPPPPVPSHLRNLAHGNPDPALLPVLRMRVAAPPVLYGEPANQPDLLALARQGFEADGVPGDAVVVVGGALDGIERVLGARLNPGDRIAVEDPGYVAVFDLVAAMGFSVVPVPVDDDGLTPEGLAAALRAGVRAVILTPRAQNPTGAALTPARARALGRLLDRHPDVLVIEDDHAGPVAGAPLVTLCAGGRPRFAVVRSVSKSLGPDLRLAAMGGDATSMARVEGRQRVGSGWVSHILQRMVVDLWGDPAVVRRVREATRAYAERRTALLDALARHGIAAHGRSGLNVWIPVPDEERAVRLLAERGWGVRPGARYRLRAPPAIRVTIATLRSADASRLARDLAAALGPAAETRTA